MPNARKAVGKSGDDQADVLAGHESPITGTSGASAKSAIYKSIVEALARDYYDLYCVDVETDDYVEYGFRTEGGRRTDERRGTDFFQTTYKNSATTVHPDDQALLRSQFTKENVLAAIEQDGVFAIDYRLKGDGLPTYVRLKAAQVEEDGKPLLIVGLLDEDARIRQEQEYARKLSVARSMATVDSLTGIKNKHAYVQWEQKIDERIKAGTQEPFAIAICDVNDLKTVNDLYGHKEGDACIKRACARICGVFSHSPVFRIGGDEFAVLLRGGDYDRRIRLIEHISSIPKDRSKVRMGDTIAAGMAVYQKGRHTSVLSVFEEADKAMYERKRLMKEACQADAFESDDDLASDDMSDINVRKRILIADDIEINRALLGELLQEDYDIAYATDGVEAIEVLRDQKDDIALVLLDLYMPNMTGREVMAAMQLDEDLMSIPVVVLTVDEKAELDCLRIGAMDFIPKPYPDIEIIKARIAKYIELSEYRDLIRHTEHDKLTGLLNKDYFYRYVRRLDHIYKDVSLDAVACDVTRFHSVNKHYGRQFGDNVLRSMGAGIKRLARKTGGICCRQDGDTFLLYCPHHDDHERLIGEFLSDVFPSKETAEKVSIRFGVFADARQEPDVEERFVCAKIAADGVRDNPLETCGFYQ